MMNMKSNKKFVKLKILYGEDYERFDQMGRQSDAQERRPAAAHHVALQRGPRSRFFPQHLPPVLRHPLDRLDGMAQYLGLAGLCVKNESFRFGLNAFKVLGGSFAMAKYIARKWAGTCPR